MDNMIRLSQIMINRTYPESGQVLYDTMVPLLSANQQVVLDMADVISLPSMFLNASIGMAAQKYQESGFLLPDKKKKNKEKK